jgi:flagellar motor switch protein FliN/FliY
MKKTTEIEHTKNIERLLDVELDVVVRFGLTHLPLREAARLGTGSMIELNRMVDEPVDLLINGHQMGRGEVVVIDDYYGVRITQIGTPEERSQTLIAQTDQIAENEEGKTE